MRREWEGNLPIVERILFRRLVQSVTSGTVGLVKHWIVPSKRN